MPRNITITFDDGTSHQYAGVPDNVTPDQVHQRATQEHGKSITNIDGGNAQPKPERSWGDVAGSAVQNLIPSTGRLIGGVAEAVMSPVKTARSLVDLGAGAIQNALPESLVNAIGADKPSQEMASRVGQFYKERYGSMPGFKEALATDPAGVAADAASVLTGAGGVARVGQFYRVPGMSRLAEGLKRSASAVDPLANVARGAGAITRGVGSTAAALLGNTTGAGSEAIKQAYGAGRAGGSKATEFADNMRGNVPMDDVLGAAKSNLLAMKQIKSAEYNKNMSSVKESQSILDFGGINKALANAKDKVMFRGQVKNQEAAEALSTIQKTLDDWNKLDPAQYHTPEGMDALKQKVGGIVEKIPFETKTAKMVGGDIVNAIKSEITKQAPEYSKAMKDYHAASDQITEMERALSLGNKASKDTAMRKLQSVMRNNVNTNYGNRQALAKQLEEMGGREIMPALAGQSLNSGTPRGLQSLGTTGAIGATAAFGNPLALGLIPLQSPKLVGEAALAAGRVAKVGRAGADAAKRVAEAARRTPYVNRVMPNEIDPRILANALYQMQQIKEQNQ
jgi:hypothetical protein